MCRAMEELIENLLQLNRLTVDEIAKISNVPLEKIQELASHLQPQMA